MLIICSPIFFIKNINVQVNKWRIKKRERGEVNSHTAFSLSKSINGNNKIKKCVFWNRYTYHRVHVGLHTCLYVHRATIKLTVTTDISGNNFRLAQVQPTGASGPRYWQRGRAQRFGWVFIIIILTVFGGRGVVYTETCAYNKRVCTYVHCTSCAQRVFIFFF